jgi:hypothetical protein
VAKLLAGFHYAGRAVLRGNVATATALGPHISAALQPQGLFLSVFVFCLAHAEVVSGQVNVHHCLGGTGHAHVKVQVMR